MATNYGQNNTSNSEISITSRGIVIYSDDLKSMETPCCLELGWWNNMVSVNFHPAIKEGSEGKGKVYDYEKSIITSLPSGKIFALNTGIKNVILPALQEGKDKNIGVQVGTDGLFIVGVKNGKPYTALYKGIDNNTKKPANKIIFEFPNGSLIEDYDSDNGSYDVMTTSESDFESFVSFLSTAKMVLTNGFSHMVKNNDKYFSRRFNSTINNIANKTGAESLIGESGGSNNYKRSSVDWGQNTNSASSESAKEEEFDNLDDLPF